LEVEDMSYTVGQLARLAGVTVRTLHHYDESGLLEPSGRTTSGYRQYADSDVTRLQQILYYRELGFPLDEIATLLDDPHADPTEHLRRQHHLLTARIHRLQEMVASVELNLEARQTGINLTPEEMLEVFGEDYTAKHAEYATEAEERWGDSDPWKESQRRTRSYAKDDWQQAKAEGDLATARLIAAMQAGLPADGDEAMGAAEALRQQITRWFYDCSYEMHRGLAHRYVQDPRFTKTYEDMATGLAQYVHDAIHANADRAAA
jgi:MerR family transcriptional regulator, thiopeptide resistance regulator